jgi:hypothetical protein
LEFGPIRKDTNEYIRRTNITINPKLAKDTAVSRFTIIHPVE